MSKQVEAQVTGSKDIFNFKVCSPMDLANPLHCILIWSIYTIYVSGKHGPEGWGNIL